MGHLPTPLKARISRSGRAAEKLTPCNLIRSITTIGRFSDAHQFVKPNDAVALELMNQSARHVCQEFKGEVIMAFGESDEYRWATSTKAKLRGDRVRSLTLELCLPVVFCSKKSAVYTIADRGEETSRHGNL